MKRRMILGLSVFFVTLFFCFSAPTFAATTTSKTCVNSAGEDSIFRLCKRKAYAHTPTQIKVTLSSFNVRFARLTLANAKSNYVLVFKDKPKTVTSSNGDKVALNYLGSDSKTAQLSIQTKSVPPAKTSVSCKGGDSTGANGFYNACVGDTITHTPTGISAKLIALSPDPKSPTADLELRWTVVPTLKLTLHHSLSVKSVDGHTLTATYMGFAEETGAQFEFSTPANPDSNIGCGNSAGNDGSYSGCLGDRITHYPTGISAVIGSYTDDHIVLLLSGAKDSQAWVFADSATQIFDSSGKKSANFTYDRKHSGSNDVSIRITTNPGSGPSTSRYCGKKSGNDGIYSGCIGDTITLEDLGIVATIIHITEDQVVIGLSGTNGTKAYLHKSKPLKIDDSAGTRSANFTYDHSSSEYGAFIKITTNP